jgi:hypothetical protein
MLFYQAEAIWPQEVKVAIYLDFANFILIVRRGWKVTNHFFPKMKKYAF